MFTDRNTKHLRAHTMTVDSAGAERGRPVSDVVGAALCVNTAHPWVKSREVVYDVVA